jgi:plastocyanin
MRYAPQRHGQQGRHILTALLIATLSSGVSTLSPAAPRSMAYAIDIEAMRFSPATLEVKMGDIVTWRNKDAFPHNASAENGAFGSGDIQSGRSWKFKAGKKGVFPYVCTLHPGMKSVLIVK